MFYRWQLKNNLHLLTALNYYYVGHIKISDFFHKYLYTFCGPLYSFLSFELQNNNYYYMHKYY